MRKVLVLEDEANIRSFIVINLRRAGYEVVEAESGEEALTKLKAQKDIRVALLDVMLPGIDGFEVCRRLRANDNMETKTLNKLCAALHCRLEDIAEYVEDPLPS